VGFIHVGAPVQYTFNLFAEAFPAEGGVVTGAGVYTVGNIVEVTATPETGWVFIGWGAPAGAFGDVNDPSTTFTMPRQDVTYTAYFAEEDTAVNTSIITVNVDPQEYGTIAGSGEYLDGSTLSLTAVPEECYRFVSRPGGGYGDCQQPWSDCEIREAERSQWVPGA
jgi:uncharacterized repeat protein (TIGR02543 family)